MTSAVTAAAATATVDAVVGEFVKSVRTECFSHDFCFFIGKTKMFAKILVLVGVAMRRRTPVIAVTVLVFNRICFYTTHESYSLRCS